MKIDSDRIATLISDYILGRLTAEDKSELDDWLLDVKNKKQFDKLIQRHTMLNKKIEYNRFENDKALAWAIVQQRTQRRIVLSRLVKYVAAIVLPFSIAWAVVYLTDDKPKTKMVSEVRQVQPGSSKALLQLATGEYIELDNSSETLIKDEAGQVIGVDSKSTLTYNSPKAKESDYNTINIPRGGEYQLVLADGTKVWLNSESSLTYPVIFTGATREVVLRGEAYFEVTSNKDQPFIVKGSKGQVQVLGTSFNVKDYEDDQVMTTTLIEGKVSLKTNTQAVILSPDMQGQVINGVDGINVQTVDARLYTAWKDGEFIFRDQTLNEIMIVLSRWYDFEYWYANTKLKDIRFSADISRYNNLQKLLNVLEKTKDVKFELNDKVLLIK